MNITDTLSDAKKSISASLNRYHLDVQGCEACLDVESFSGQEFVSSGYRYKIDFTSANQDISQQAMLNRSTTLIMQTAGALMAGLSAAQVQKVVHGVVTNFTRVSGSTDEAHYQITIEPFFALLDKQKRTHRFFLNKSIPEVIEQILREHNFNGWEFEFKLKQSYPIREQINQFGESDRDFIERLMSEVGIFYTFALQQDTQTEVLILGDKQSCYVFGKTLPLGNPAGMNDNGVESVWGLSQRHQVVESSVQAKDYNYREAQLSLLSSRADMTRGDGEGITYGDVYQYQPRHLTRGDATTPAPESGNFWARLEHERFLAAQTQLQGSSTDASLCLLEVLTVMDSDIPSSLPSVWQTPVVITGLRFSASRSTPLHVKFNAVPYSETLCWRPALKPRPKVSGTMMARVTSAKSNDIYAWQDASGLYRVKFDADQDEKAQGQESMPVRLAKPYGGDVYGIHFPLIQGTEVAIAFHDGDPDRPYIAHALHDSRHTDHVTEKNNTRNVIRTPANNKLRMEDKRGEEHIKLSTEYGGKTQLNLGHNVDAGRGKRGEGAELRTDKWVSIRGAKGIFLSADGQPKAQGQMLDMNAAIAQLQDSLQLVTSLAQSAKVSGALDPDTASQQQLSSVLSQLKEAGLLASAPAGIGLTTPKNIQLSAGHTLTATAGENVDMTIFKKLTVAAGEAISLFAQKMGVKILAARGMVDIQAQTDAIRLQSDKTMNINSVNGEIVINAGQGITLTSKGGAYIKIKDGAVEIGAPGKINLKSIDIDWGGSSSLEQALTPVTVTDPQYKYPMAERFQVQDKASGQPKPYIPYRIETADGTSIRGVTDENGYTQGHHGVDPQSIKLFFE